MPPLRLLAPIGALLAGLGLVSACAGHGPASPTPTTWRLTDSDAGRAISLHVGDRLEVTLAGNPTTGYQWEVGAGDAAVLKVAGEPQFTADSNLPGSGGRVMLPFNAVGAGHTNLQLIYHRPFEAGVAPARTFSVTVTVK